METLVATVLIVVVFMASSMILNNLFTNSITFNENEVLQELLRLQYDYQNELISAPYYDEFGDWTLEVTNENWKNNAQVIFRAKNENANREIIMKR